MGTYSVQIKRIALLSMYVPLPMAGVHMSALTLGPVRRSALATLATVSMQTARAALRSTIALAITVVVHRRALTLGLRQAFAHVQRAIRLLVMVLHVRR